MSQYSDLPQSSLSRTPRITHPPSRHHTCAVPSPGRPRSRVWHGSILLNPNQPNQLADWPNLIQSTMTTCIPTHIQSNPLYPAVAKHCSTKMFSFSIYYEQLTEYLDNKTTVMQWQTSAKSLKHTVKAKCSHSLFKQSGFESPSEDFDGLYFRSRKLRSNPI